MGSVLVIMLTDLVVGSRLNAEDCGDHELPICAELGGASVDLIAEMLA